MNINYTYLTIFNNLNGKIHISFPDFPELLKTADSDEEAIKIAKKALTEKLEIFKENDVDFPIPMKIGEFITKNDEIVMPISVSLNIVLLKNGMDDISSAKIFDNKTLDHYLDKVADIVGNPIDEFLEEKDMINLKQNVGIIGAVLYTLSVFFPLISITSLIKVKATLFTPITFASSFGVSPGFWGYIAFLLGILMILSGIFSGYTSYVQNTNLFKSALLANILLFILATLIAIITILKIGVGGLSWGVITFILSIIIMLANYSILKKDVSPDFIIYNTEE